MRSNQVDEFFTRCQYRMYAELNRTSEKNPPLGYLFAIPVVMADVALKLIKVIAQVIESLVLAIFNLIGATCGKHAEWAHGCQIKDTIYYVEKMFKKIAYVAVAALLTPIYLIYQLTISFMYPTKVNPIHEKLAINCVEISNPLESNNWAFS